MKILIKTALLTILILATVAPVIKCWRHQGVPAKFTGKTRFEGRECQFSHLHNGVVHEFWVTCKDYQTY